MQVKVEEIRDTGLTLNEPVSEKLLASALEEHGHETGFHPVGPTNLEVSFKRVSGGVLLNGKLTPKLTAPCKRCVTDVQFEVPITFSLNLIPESQVKAAADVGEGEDDEAAEESGSFDLEAADQEVFNGKTIDLDPIVREQVLLALPMNVVCREDCKGLCAVCGEDRNTKDCGHEQRVLDPRLMALKDIKLKPN
jgi:uncharacterized protein